MSIEGLQALLTKETIVGTQAADRLSQAPQVVEEAYLHHVRSYVPFGRAAEGEEQVLTVPQFEKRLITLVKEGKAPTGYVTAEYGYGKTSTCLYLWQRCRDANLVAVPPFEFTQLSQLISATHAWVCYELNRVKPELVTQANDIRSKYETHSLEELAQQQHVSIDVLKDLYARGQLILTLAPIFYVQFFEEITQLVLAAGFDGLVILPDELQQYLDPLVKGGVKEPFAALFDIVQGMITRRGSLKCGLIFSVPARELAMFNEQRGDLVQRLKSQGLGFDLRNVYTADFAAQLWERLADQFDFRAECGVIVHPATLHAIGEITARRDLASGPRTVVAIFQRIVDRYLNSRTKERLPYTPINLVDDYLAGAIPFDETGKIQQVVNARLSAHVVVGHPKLEQVVRLIAAFPTEGCPRQLLDEFALAAASDELAAAGQGDLIIFLGSAAAPGMTLRGLEPQNEGPTDWLTATLRDFSRSYVDTADLTMNRAVDAFERLLLERVFTAPHWKKITAFEKRLTQHRGLLLEGSFAGTARLYPQRRVHVRILRENELLGVEPSDVNRSVQAGLFDADMLIDFVLYTHLDQTLEQRSSVTGSVENTDARHLLVNFNLSHRAETTLRQDLHNKLQPVVNPYKICPLLLLSLDEYLEEKRTRNQIPKAEDDLIKNTFQLSLIDVCFADLFNGSLVGPHGATGSKLVEALFYDACHRLFPHYKTLMLNSQWQGAMNEYRRALKELPSQLERQGEAEVEGPKSQIAQLMGRTNVGFDSFATSFPALLNIERGFRGNDPGAVLFTMHPLEQTIQQAVKSSKRKVEVVHPGRPPQSMPALAEKAVYSLASEQGYRERETEEVLEIMQTRELIERVTQHGGLIVLAPPHGVQVNELVTAVTALQAQIHPLVDFYGGDALGRYQQQLEAITQAIPDLRRKANAEAVAKVYTTVRTYHKQVEALIADKHTALRTEVGRLTILEAPATNKLELLARPVSLDLFGPHLEGIRHELQRNYSRQAEKCGEMSTNLVQVQNAVAQEVNSAELVALARRTAAIADRLKKTQEAGYELDRRFFAFVQASTVLDNAARLQRRLLDRGPRMSQCLVEFNSFIHEINTALATQRQEALRDVNLWDNQLGQVQQYADESEQAQRAGFEQWQARYRTLLETHLSVASYDLPHSQTYNPDNPQESMDRFSTEVSQTIARVLDGLLLECRGTQDKLAAIAYSGDLATLPAPQGDVAAGRAEECQTILGDVKKQASTLTEQAVDSRDIFVDPSPVFEKFCHALGQIQAKVRHMVDLLRQVESALAEARLGDLEQNLLDALCVLTARDGITVDMGMVLQHSGQPIESLMQLLGTLYMKRRVRIILEPITSSPSIGLASSD